MTAKPSQKLLEIDVDFLGACARAPSNVEGVGCDQGLRSKNPVPELSTLKRAGAQEPKSQPRPAL